MKKLPIALVFASLTVSAFAAQIPRDKLASYKEAAIFALSKANLVCKSNSSSFEWGSGSSNADGLARKIAQANSAELNASGVQPVLIFNRDDAFFGQSIAITTTADFLSIVSVDYSYFGISTQQVNLGTLVNPNMVTQQIKSMLISVSCN